MLNVFSDTYNLVLQGKCSPERNSGDAFILMNQGEAVIQWLEILSNIKIIQYMNIRNAFMFWLLCSVLAWYILAVFQETTTRIEPFSLALYLIRR